MPNRMPKTRRLSVDNPQKPLFHLWTIPRYELFTKVCVILTNLSEIAESTAPGNEYGPPDETVSGSIRWPGMAEGEGTPNGLSAPR